MKNLGKITQEQIFAMKISILKEKVFPDKRKSPFKSKSFKIVPPPSMRLFEKNTDSQNSPSPSCEKHSQLISPDSTQKFIRLTNVQFSPRKSASELPLSWTGQSWLPSKTNVPLLRLQRTKSKQEPKTGRIICQTPTVESPIKKYQPKDSQSLVKKNSLFLLNFIKSREKKNNLKNHLGQFPIILDRIQKKKVPQEMIQTTRQEREKKFMSNLKSVKEDRLKRISEHNQQNLICPSPW